MNRCKTCKHWDAFEYAGQIGWGACGRLDTDYKDRMSKLVRLHARGWETESADADTHETFGCVEHEERGS